MAGQRSQYCKSEFAVSQRSWYFRSVVTVWQVKGQGMAVLSTKSLQNYEDEEGWGDI
jgi:hypothetical protein